MSVTATQQALIDEVWGPESESDESYVQLHQEFTQELYDSSDFEESAIEEVMSGSPVEETEEETRTQPIPAECYRPGADVTTQLEGIWDDHAAAAAKYREFGGDSNPNWLFFLDTLKRSTRDQYESRVKQFFLYRYLHNRDGNATYLWKDLIFYFKHEHDRSHYAGSVFKSWLAIFKRFFEMCSYGDLKVLAPVLGVAVRHWAKESDVKKAFVFSAEEILRYLHFEDTPETLVRKMFAVVSISFAGRVKEVFDLNFENIDRMTVTDDRGKVCENFRIYYTRLKVGVAQSSGEDYATVSGEHEIKVMKRYLQCFSPKMREEKGGRLFRKLKYDSYGKITATNNVIGENTVRMYSKQIAKSLCLEDSDRYTSHSLPQSKAYRLWRLKHYRVTEVIV